MGFSLEVLFGVGTVVLLLAMAVATIRWHRRNRVKDRIAEIATHELYAHPETYPEKRAELEKQVPRS